jgi:hypothetical protein
MRRWHRAIALFLMIVFAPATVLAAMPAQMCIGADGHRAIESALTGHHATGIEHQAGTGRSSDADAFTDVVTEAPCFDVAIAVATGPTVRSIQFDFASSDESKSQQPWLQPGQAVVEATGHGTVRTPSHISSSSPDQFLAALATVVLLN